MCCRTDDFVNTAFVRRECGAGLGLPLVVPGPACGSFSSFYFQNVFLKQPNRAEDCHNMAAVCDV